MKHQKRIVKTKIQLPEKGLTETEITNLDKDFKINIINMFTELQKNIQDLRKDFKKEIETLKNTVSEMKHTMEGFKNRLDEVEEMVNVIEIKEQRNKEVEQKRK